MDEPNESKSAAARAGASRPHRRYNPLTRSWVLVSPQRTQRPWQGQTNKPTAPEQLKYDPTCYLCPGNERAGGAKNPRYTGVFAFDNDYPALLPADPTQAPPASEGLLKAEPEVGRCRVVCFSPDHSLRLAQMTREGIEAVIQTWKAETEQLGSSPDINYVQIFENRGAMMGASNPHPHCQIWATGHVPDEPMAEGEAQRVYLETHQRTLLSDYRDQELQARERIVCENDSFVAVVPFWAVWPFETLVMAKRSIASFVDFSPEQTSGLADLLKRLTTRYDNLFHTSFPYTMGFHQRPVDGKPYPEWEFHCHFYPPLLRSAEIRKFMVGFEMLGMPQRDITAETAAEMLRAAGEDSQ